MIHSLLTLFLFFSTGLLHGAEPALLQMQTTPYPTEVHPQQDTLSFRILIHRSDGAPVSGARLRVRLQAPATPWLASTDFPVVEGTALIDSDLQIDRGEYSFRIVPPIRGVYTLTASVTPLPGDNSFLPTQKQWQTEITESPHKKRNLALLLFILIGIGSVSGFVLGRNRAAVLFLISLLTGWHTTPVSAHGDHQHSSAKAPPQKVVSDQGGTVQLQLLTPKPRVGELASLTARYADDQGRLQPARFRLQVIQLEHAREVFTTEVAAADGILQWQGQFYDGSDHRVAVEAVPWSETWAAGNVARAELDVAVEGVAPPTRSIVKSLGFLLAITALGLALGVCIGRFFPVKEDGLI